MRDEAECWNVDDNFKIMAYIKHEEFWERNEYEMCQIFADLLFMNVEKFSPDLADDPDRVYLNGKDIALLDKTKIINRIFRKWMQTAWLNEGDSQHFEGATPRQELAALYPDLDLGRDFLTARLQQDQFGKWTVVPAYFSRETLKESGGGVFEAGMKNIKTAKPGEVAAPNFDCEFSAFIDFLDLIANIGKKKEEFSGEFHKYFSLFLHNAPANVILNSGLDLKEEKFLKMTGELYHYLYWLFTHQKKGKDDFFGMDPVFRTIWGIFQKFNKNLAGYDELARMDDRSMAGFHKESKNFQKSTEVFHRLGVAFDRYFLFPADCYFGGMECVWTSRESFFDSMGITLSFLKNNLKPPEFNSEARKIIDITDTLSDLKYIWFAPPTAFRFLECLYND